jgi:hypothetical protein
MPDIGAFAFSVGMVLATAGAMQTVQTPMEWPRTIRGYGTRVSDIAGFTVVEVATQKSLEAIYGWKPYSAVCVRERIVSCAYERTFTGFDRNGIRRRNLPLVAGIVVGASASVLWRPERQDNTKALMLIGTRIITSSAATWTGRVVHDWMATKPVPVSR